MKTLIAALIVLFFVLQYKLWFGQGGFIDVIHHKQMVAQQTKKNSKIEQRNAILSASIKALQNNKEALETRARNELGMVKKGETYYQVVKQSGDVPNLTTY